MGENEGISLNQAARAVNLRQRERAEERERDLTETRREGDPAHTGKTLCCDNVSEKQSSEWSCGLFLLFLFLEYLRVFLEFTEIFRGW